MNRPPRPHRPESSTRPKTRDKKNVKKKIKNPRCPLSGKLQIDIDSKHPEGGKKIHPNKQTNKHPANIVTGSTHDRVFYISETGCVDLRKGAEPMEINHPIDRSGMLVG